MHSDSTTPAAAPVRRSFVASPWHTLSILLIFGYFSFHDTQRVQTAVASQGVVPHATVLRGYLLSIAYEWGMAYWAWVGVHWKGGHLRRPHGRPLD